MTLASGGFADSKDPLTLVTRHKVAPVLRRRALVSVLQRVPCSKSTYNCVGGREY